MANSFYAIWMPPFVRSAEEAKFPSLYSANGGGRGMVRNRVEGLRAISARIHLNYCSLWREDGRSHNCGTSFATYIKGLLTVQENGRRAELLGTDS